MSSSKVVIFFLLVLTIRVQKVYNAPKRIYFDRCAYNGFSCVKIDNKYDITYNCNATQDVELYFRHFRALSQSRNLHISNCTKLTLYLQCTLENRPFEKLHLSNITHLNITSSKFGVSYFPPEVIFENIERIESIPPRTFIQIKQTHIASCSGPFQKLEKVVFKNVSIGTIEHEAFYDLSEVGNVTFENVKIDQIKSGAMEIFQKSNNEVKIIGSKIGVMEFHSFVMHGSNLKIHSTSIDKIHSIALNATVFNFEFGNNTVGRLQPGGMHILAQNVRIMDSTFAYISTGAFQGIGPGIPGNIFKSFGQLQFTYEFRNNLIESLDVGSLHSDWHAYKNVFSVIKFSYNAIKCSCAELAWLGIKEGLGKGLSNLGYFHDIVLNKENNNICSDAPCILPIESVQHLSIQNGRCSSNITLDQLCTLYYSTSTTTTTIKPKLHKITHKNFTNLPVVYKRIPARSFSNKVDINIYLIFITFIIILI